jgi:hypothetical protein
MNLTKSNKKYRSKDIKSILKGAKFFLVKKFQNSETNYNQI